MIAPKITLIAHLERIYCAGEIGEAVFTDRYAVNAVTGDRQLMVHAEGLAGVEPLVSEVGVVDLPLLLNCMKSLGEEDGKVSIEFVDHRIVVEERGRSKVQMVTASAETIGSKVSPDNAAKLLARVVGGRKTILNQSVVQDLLKLNNLLKADLIAARVEPSRIIWTVGQKTGHFAEVTMPAAESVLAEPYELAFNSRVLAAVLRQVHDFTQTMFVTTGPDALVAVTDPSYTYLVSPVKREKTS